MMVNTILIQPLVALIAGILILVMPRLLKRWHASQIFAASFAFGTLRFVLIGWGADQVWLMVLAQLMHAATFGAYHAAALGMVNLKDTLLLVTADHSHTLTISGYPQRGNPILGVVRDVDGKVTKAKDGKAFTTLGYANGSGAVEGVRPDPERQDTGAVDYKQQALIPLSGETHGGEDVAVRASGPMAHLFKGTIEQHTIYHVMREAMR